MTQARPRHHTRTRHTRTHTRALALALTAALAACSGGSSRGTTSPLPVPANIPPGSGNVAIVMVGTWEIRDVVVLESNSTTAAPPLAGTQFVIDGTGIVSIGGLPVARTSLETILGFPLVWYVNQADGRTLLYGLGFDQHAAGGTKEAVGLAAGAVDDNSIAVESFTEKQATASSVAGFIRSRYTLARISAAPLYVSPPADGAAASDALRAVFGRL